MTEEDVRKMVADEMEANGGNLVRAVYRVHEDLYSREDTSKVACGKGCSLCCHQQPACSAAEWAEVEAYIEKHDMRASIEEENFETLREWDEYKIMHWREIHEDPYKLFLHWLGRKPCIFLGKDGACKVYEARPMLCRTFTSTIKCMSHEQVGAMNFRYKFQEWLISMLMETGASMTFIDQFNGLKEPK